MRRVIHRAVDLAVRERDVHAIAGRHADGAAHDRRPVGVPAHSIASSEDGEGTEALETAGQRAEARVGAKARPVNRGCQPSAGGAEAAAHRGETPREIPLLETLTERPVSPSASVDRTAHRTPELMRELGGVAAAHRDARLEAGEPAA